MNVKELLLGRREWDFHIKGEAESTKYLIESCNLYGEIEIEDNGMIKVIFPSNNKLQQDLEKTLSQGVPCYKSFKNPQIPGMIKYYRRIESKDDLNSILKEFDIGRYFDFDFPYEGSTFYVKDMETKKIDYNICLNGITINYIPEFDVDLTKDLIISNGHIMVASYIGDYENCLGFFEEKRYSLPVAWIHNPVFIKIDIYEKECSRTFIIESESSLEGLL